MGFTDNGGAIHTAERNLNILGLRLNYPDIGHPNDLRKSDNAEFSVEALAAHERGGKVFIEHVSPHRDFTRKAIAKIEGGATDEQFKKFVQLHRHNDGADETKEGGITSPASLVPPPAGWPRRPGRYVVTAAGQERPSFAKICGVLAVAAGRRLQMMNSARPQIA